MEVGDILPARRDQLHQLQAAAAKHTPAKGMLRYWRHKRVRSAGREDEMGTYQMGPPLRGSYMSLVVRPAKTLHRPLQSVLM